MSADGEYIVVGNHEEDNRLYLFNKDSSTPLWYYNATNNINAVSISKDGEYIVAGTHDHKIHFFDKDSNIPLWTYATGYVMYGVSISADGKYMVGGGLDDNLYTFKNNLTSRPSIIPYGPSDETTVTNPVNLNWFSGSDDNENLTFDLYLGTTTRISDTSVFARVNNTITLTEKLTLDSDTNWDVYLESVQIYFNGGGSNWASPDAAAIFIESS